MYASDAAHAKPSLTAKLSALYTLHSSGIDLTIRAPYLALLERLGNPHKYLPPTIHVAGTNGKGSTIAFMRAILEAAGYSVHVYTSPHLVRFNERIVLAGQEIGDDALEALLDEATALNNGGAITFFEMTTAVAFAAFARHPADILLLETGMGGRLDCTNVIEHPAATVITAIGYDHMEFLGDTLESIAREKAGIMKKDVPCVVAPQTDATINFFLKREATRISAHAIIYGQDWNSTMMAAGGGQVKWNGARVIFPSPSLAGFHQIDNAATAIQTLSVLNGVTISSSAVMQGVSNARWLGRLQRIRVFRDQSLPDTVALWVDGAHNGHASIALAKTLSAWGEHNPVNIVVAMLNKRSPQDFLEPILPHAATLTATTIPGSQECHTAETIAQSAISIGFPSEKILVDCNPISAVSRLLEKRQTCLVTGSLYLAQHFL